VLTKNKIKLVRSLEHRKYRQTNGLFVAEGPKVVGDLLGRFSCRYVCCTPEWESCLPSIPSDVETDVISSDDLRKLSFQEHPQQVLALFEMPGPADESVVRSFIGDYDSGTDNGKGLCLALDCVQNPGNVGTIIRLADWFGISAVVCSQATADVFSPKVVQATMGSLARVDVCQDVDLPAFLSSLQSTVPVYGTFLDGNNIYSSHLSPFGVIVMGNEGKGISDAVARCVNRRITIPNFNGADKGADSLNVAVATAVVCSEFRRMSAT